jgi:hypothetical protein
VVGLRLVRLRVGRVLDRQLPDRSVARSPSARASQVMPDNVVRLRKLDPATTTLTVRVVQTHELRFRLWLGLKLISLAGRIIGMRVEVKPEEPEEVCR